MSGFVPYASDDEATPPTRLNTPRRGAGRWQEPVSQPAYEAAGPLGAAAGRSTTPQRGATPHSRSRDGTPRRSRSRSPYRPSGQESPYAPGGAGYQQANAAVNAAGTASAGSDGVGPFPYVKQTTPTYGDQPYAPPFVEATTPTYGNQPYPVANLAADPAAHDLQQQVLIAEEQPRSDAYSYEVPAVRQAGYPLQPGGRKFPSKNGRASPGELTPDGKLIKPGVETFDIEQGDGVVEEQRSTFARAVSFGQVQGRHHPSAAAAFPQAKGIADVDYGQGPGAGVEGDQRWKAPVLPPVDEPVGKRRLEWTRPSQRKWNIAWEMVLLVLAWLAVTIAYVVVRATKSLHLGPATAYGVWVLVMEALGATTLVIYSIHLCVRIRKFTPPPVRDPFSVRVMVPCYKEDIETLNDTLTAAVKAAKLAMDANMANAVHVYLCDDSPKGFMEEHNGVKRLAADLHQEVADYLVQEHGIPIIRVTREKDKGGESNPKSSNLNNCLRQIYGDSVPPASEVIAVFDADQAAHGYFFTKVLPWMDAGDDVAVVQSPQVFRGVSYWDDVFNHENVGFWHYLQPAYNVMGFISCAGTNFLIRANAFAQAGWFPTHTLTEDYALGMEMRRRGWREVYVEQELVRGSAPDKVRGAFGQRSRWCKGPYQMLFSRKSPLFAKGLNLLDRILYLSPCYIYVVSGIATPTFIAIPLVYIWAGKFPASLTSSVVSLLVAYAILSSVVKYYVRPGRNIIHDIKSHWNAEVSTKNFWWMYIKAAVRGTMSKCGCLTLGWTPGAGGKKVANCWTKSCEAKNDLLPHCLFAFIMAATIAYGFVMVAAGAKFVGPLGISLVWACYHLTSPLLLILYTLLPFRHEVRHDKVFFNGGRWLFTIICQIGFVASFGSFVLAIVLAYKTKHLCAFSASCGDDSCYWMSPSHTFSYMRGRHVPGTC